MPTFNAKLQIIDINPYVSLPDNVLQSIFRQAGKETSPIRVKGTVNKKGYTQTLVRFRGEWRLYINLLMLKDSPKRIGEMLTVTITYDSETREIVPPAKFIKALQQNKEAKETFERLTPSRKKEITRYLANLKTEESLAKNITRAIDFLTGTGRFVGRDKP